jgi:hypothetical protein
MTANEKKPDFSGYNGEIAHLVEYFHGFKKSLSSEKRAEVNAYCKERVKQVEEIL